MDIRKTLTGTLGPVPPDSTRQATLEQRCSELEAKYADLWAVADSRKGRNRELRLERRELAERNRRLTTEAAVVVEWLEDCRLSRNDWRRRAWAAEREVDAARVLASRAHELARRKAVKTALAFASAYTVFAAAVVTWVWG